MDAHFEVPIKVNSWVDEGVAALVGALNEFEDVWTLASCENDRSELKQGAYVMFAYRGADARGADAEAFAARLRRQFPPVVRLAVDWQPGEDEPPPR